MTRVYIAFGLQLRVYYEQLKSNLSWAKFRTTYINKNYVLVCLNV